MKIARLTTEIVAGVLALMACGAMAQAPVAKPEAASNESTFKGTVVSADAVGFTVKGDFDPPLSPAGKAGAKGKAAARSVHFFLMGAKITRNWHPIEPKDIPKGSTVTVTFTQPTQGRSRYVVSRVEIADEASAEKQAILGKPGKVLLEDDFSREQITPKWRPGKGFWEVHEGVVTAAENPDDHHGAYAYAEPHFPYKDIVAEFAFKFDGSTGCNFMMEDSNYKESHAGHIIRATITPTTAQLADSKFGAMKNEIHEKMKDPQTTPEEKKQIQASIQDKSATFKVNVDAGKWHQARVEVVGDEMLLSVDNRPVAYLKSEGVNHPTKNMVGFTIAGKSTQLDNVKVCEATLREDWSQVRSTVLGTLQKP